MAGTAQVQDPSRLLEDLKITPDLMLNYKTCLLSGDQEEVRKTIANFLSLITSESSTTGYELRKVATKLQEAKRPLDSIPLLYAAASLHKLEADQTKVSKVDRTLDAGVVAMKQMGLCVYGMWNVNRGIVRADVSMKRVIKDHVLPLMRDVVDDMEKVTTVTEETKCEQVVWVMYPVEWSEGLIGESAAEIETYDRRFASLRKTFGTDAEKRWIYGDLLKDLGDLYKKKMQFDDATSCYQHAVEVFRVAHDVSDESFRNCLVKSCEDEMKKVQKYNI